MLKESTILKENLCIYKCFIDVLYIFDRVSKEKLGNVPDLRQISLILVLILRCAQPILLVGTDPDDPVSVT